MRGRTQVGATLIDVLDDYADALAERGGRLYLTGVDEDVADVLRRAHKLDIGQGVHLFPEESVVLESTGAAVGAANEWLGRARKRSHRATVP
jgi:SulP family sulfate permease